MSESDLPSGTALRRAVRWLSEQRSESPDANVAALIAKASMRFDLFPLETNALLGQPVRSAEPSDGTRNS